MLFGGGLLTGGFRLPIADRAECGLWPMSCGCTDIWFVEMGVERWVTYCLSHGILYWVAELGEC